MAAAAADDVMMTTVIEGEASRRCDVEITRTTYLFERLNDLLLSAWYEMSSQLRLHDQQTTPTATSDHKADSKVSEWLTDTNGSDSSVGSCARRTVRRDVA